MPTPPDPEPTWVDPWLPATPIPAVVPAIATKVYRYTPGLEDDELKELPNVLVDAVEQREGADPGVAVFRYDFTYPDEDAPHSCEEAVSTEFDTPLTVDVNDRLVVKGLKPGGSFEWLFDGFALAWDVTLARGVEQVHITAEGVAKRCWQETIPGAVMRHADDPTAVDDFETDLKAQFNPKGKPNATPGGADSGEQDIDGDRKYPVFLDPLVVRDPDVRRKWTLAMAARYILFRFNGQEFVKNPDGSDLDLLLVSKEPYGDSPFDPDDVATYNAKPIIVADTPITGRDWPTALYDLIRDYGFGYRFELGSDAEGKPETKIVLAQQQAGPKKPLMIQARGSQLDRSLTNTLSLEAGRDLRDVANEWWVRGRLERHEASFVLECGFPCATGDGASLSAIGAFAKSSAGFNGNRNKYRLYVFGETGEKRYAPGTSTEITTVPTLDAVLGNSNYARRRRPPIGELLTTDDEGRPLRAKLSISKDYAGNRPGVWDGTGTWQPVQGGYELLKDRLGVYVSCENPNRWQIGASKEPTHPYPVGVVNGVEAQAGGGNHFWLRLTVVIEGDKAVVGKGIKRTASPIGQRIVRTIDASDRYRLDKVAPHSEFNNVADPKVIRDDTDDATAEATAVRYTTESGVLVGKFQISHPTTAYRIGDRIEKVRGRGMSFRTDAGGAGENPILPVVVGRRLEFFPNQLTRIITTDAGTDRGQFKQAIHNRKRHV